MRTLGIVLLLALALSCGWADETTPLDQVVLEETETLITCELKTAPQWQDIPVFDSAKDSEAAKGIYHYKLWLPKGYLANPRSNWPCMFITDAEGQAKMGNMAAWLKSNGYVVVMLVESKNGEWPPAVGNFLAAHADVVRRVRIQAGLKFATGMSGGARASALSVQICPGFCGLILQGAGLSYDSAHQYQIAGIQRNPALWVAMTMGDSDPNQREAERVKQALGVSRFLSFPFQGGHQWAPQENFDTAMTWIEHQVYEEGSANHAFKPIYLQRFKQQMDKFSKLTVPVDRYKHATSLIKFAQSRNLTTEATIAPVLRELQIEVTRLHADPNITTTIQAN